MGYCTLTDLLAGMDENDLIRFTDDAENGIPDEEVIAQKITQATALVDSYISGRYGTGLDPVPSLVVSLTVDICLYKIGSRRGAAPEELRTGYEDAVSLLEKIAAGKTDIPDVDREDDEPQGANDPAAAVVAPGVVFTGSGSGLGGY